MCKTVRDLCRGFGVAEKHTEKPYVLGGWLVYLYKLRRWGQRGEGGVDKPDAVLVLVRVASPTSTASQRKEHRPSVTRFALSVTKSGEKLHMVLTVTCQYIRR